MRIQVQYVRASLSVFCFEAKSLFYSVSLLGKIHTGGSQAGETFLLSYKLHDIKMHAVPTVILYRRGGREAGFQKRSILAARCGEQYNNKKGESVIFHGEAVFSEFF